MILHNLKISFRNIARHKVQTLISVVGLALGMVCFSMSFLWLRYISSYEDFVPDADRVYLVGNKAKGAVTNASYLTPDLISDVLKEIPEIEEVSKTTMIYSNGPKSAALFNDIEDLREYQYTVEDRFDVIEISDNFIDFFGVKVISGDIKNLLENEIILTESTAKRLFGNSNPIGEDVYIQYRDLQGEEMIKKVKAIISDAPDNTQFVYDGMIALRPVDQVRRYFNSMYYTFLKVLPGVTEQQINEKLKGSKFKIPSWKDPSSTSEAEFDYDIMPLRALRTEYIQDDDSIKTQYVRFFVAVGILVIIFSLINYILTTVSQIRSRSRQLAIRTISGASLWDLLKLNITETVVIFFLAALLGLVASFLLLPKFKEYAMITASGNTLLFVLISYVVAIVVVGVFIVGCATAIVVRRTQRSIIEGHQTQRSSSVLDKVSCILQLTLSMAMIFATLIMYCQLRYLTQSNALGFKRSDIVGIWFSEQNEDFKRQAKALPMVKESLDSLSFIYPTNLTVSTQVTVRDKDGNEKMKDYLEIVTLKEPQVQFWELEVVQGRMFQEGKAEMIVNQSVAERLGGEDIIGSTIEIPEKTYQIVGVLRNLYTMSPLQDPQPTLYTSDELQSMEMFDMFTTYKLYPGQKKEFLKALSEIEPQPKYSLRDIEEVYNQKFKSEFMLMRLLTLIGLCGLFVSIMGAYSVLSLSLQERRKEMALRKINGAKRRIIIGLFLRSNLYSLLVASVVAFPSVYIIMQNWIEQYPKHISMPWYLIPIILLSMIILTTLTVITKVNKASKENSADVLKE